MTRRAAKTFERGELIQIQRTPGARWTLGHYDCPSMVRAGWHWVSRQRSEFLDIVPSRRIRKRSVK